MKFSYSAVWEDTVRMLKSHGSVLLALAGVFFLLPSLLTGYALPTPTGSETDAIGAMAAYYRQNWLWLLLGGIVNSVGAIAIYLLLFDRRGGTVGSAIAGALPIVPFYFIMSLIMSVAVGLGLVLLIVPGIYLLGRFATAGALMVAERRPNPFQAIGGSWRLTKSRGWAVAGLVLLVAVAGVVLSFAITAVLGSIFLLIGGRDGVGGLLVLILSSALSAALYTVLIVLLAAIYRRLTGTESADPAAA
jgi:hypothetical protein